MVSLFETIRSGYNLKEPPLDFTELRKESEMSFSRTPFKTCTALMVTVFLVTSVPVLSWDWEVHGTLGPGDPTFNRPSTSFPPCSLSSNGTAVYYDVYTETWLGGYAHVEMTGTISRPVIASYPAGTFNPTNPCDNILTVGGCEPLPLSFIGPVLGPPGQYDIVITHCYNGDSGSYDLYMEAVLFWDGFESGNTTAWSATMP